MDPVQKILREAETIAVVGLSNNRDRPAYEIAEYLQRNGYHIVPVNPNETDVLGEPSYPDLLSVPGRVDIVNVFRNPRYVPEIVRQAIARGARLVWMQPGAENYDAAEMAEAAGLEVVVGMCIRVQHRRVRAL